MKQSLQQTITKELNNCNVLLDLCAGPGKWADNNKISRKIAVELNSKYNSELEKRGYKILNIDVRDVTEIDNLDYDVILWIDGIEHLEEKEALNVLETAENSTKKILVFTPNEFVNNHESVNNLNEPLQEHKSVFPETFWIERGYEVIYREYNKAAQVNNILYKKVFQ